MSAARLDGVARWVWQGRGTGAGIARGALLPLAGLYRLAVAARNAAYDAGALSSRPLPLPSVGVGNLAVGGAGKTPVAAYVARELAARSGVKPAIVLRGYGADEAAAHAREVPEAIVVADPDRARGAAAAVQSGAGVLVLDDCLQRRDVQVDVMLALVAAESWDTERWPLPAGPWREGIAALWRADAVIVTRKTAGAERAAALARELAPAAGGRGVVAELALTKLAPLSGFGEPLPVRWLAGRSVLAVSGIANPAAFAAQLEAAGAKVEPLVFGDHHAYSAADVADIGKRAAGRPVITTAKDAVKLGRLWPADASPCLTALLEVRPTEGRAVLQDLLDRVARAARTFTQSEAASGPLHHT